MFAPSPESMLREVFGIEHEDYNRGFADGYERAKQEMLDKIKKMELYLLMSATSSTEGDLDE